MVLKGEEDGNGILVGNMRKGIQGRGTSNMISVMMMPIDAEEDEVKRNEGLKGSREEQRRQRCFGSYFVVSVSQEGAEASPKEKL